MITLLDGALGTELAQRGVELALPNWSAHALTSHEDLVKAIHREYALAGATVHTANTFRTKRRHLGQCWEEQLRKAVALTRASVPLSHRVAGSVAPLEDCYLKASAPPTAREEHRELVRALQASGVDLVLCETFPNVDEALIATEEAARTGLETWTSFTAGPWADLLRPEELRAAAAEASARGANVVLVNCVAATRVAPFVEALSAAGVPFGVYANAGEPSEQIGWEHSVAGAHRYAELAERWVSLGATVIGGCCGTGPSHVQALSSRRISRAPA